MDFSRPKCLKELQGGASPSYQWLYNAMSKFDISANPCYATYNMALESH